MQNSNFIKSSKLEEQLKVSTLMIYKGLIDNTLDDTITNSTQKGALITSILRLYLYVESIYLLNNDSNMYRAMQDFVAKLGARVVEELKKTEEP